MTVTRNTPWRSEINVPYEFWRDMISSARNPNGTGEKADPELASEAAWKMAYPLQSLCLAMLKAESSYGTDFAANPRSNKNPLNLKLPAGGGYVSNLTWTGGIQSWRQRITSQTYKDGIYANTNSIADLIHVFAPTSENATESYIAGVVSRMNSYPEVVNVPSTPEEPMADLVFGTVPHPSYQDRYISNSTAWNDLGKRGAKCVVWHRMYGTLWGTDGYLRGEASGKALTDYGVGVSATDGANQAGVILRWNDPLGRRAPWASGPVNNPIGDGAKFVNLYGVNAVNRDGVSIEISGNGGTALDSKARAAVVALTAYWADQYGKVLAAKGKQFDHTTFPLIPSEDNRSFVCYHGEFYDGKRNSCPGPIVEAATNGMLAEVKAILKEYQTKTAQPEKPPAYAKPQPPAAGDSVVNGRIFLAHAQEYTTLAAVTPRIYADPGSDPTGPDIVKGARVTTTHVVSDVGESADLTAVLADGSRVPIKGILVAA